MNEWFGSIGTLLTLVGIIIAVFQIRKTTRAAEAARVAAEITTSNIQLNVTLSDVSSCVNEVEEIKVLIRSMRYEAALLRVTDLSGRLIQLKNIPNNNNTNEQFKNKENLAQLSILRDLLERKLQDRNLEIKPSSVNKILSDISDDLHAWIGSNKYLSSGESE
ncbi:MAG: hypothetical protein N0C86_14985 [Candidatus Thiodiazotropha taylori]|nr:hypothetical protein [Candidatus Thiodiazotropha taylori]MCW4327298.1 hypothetical protein [Candidatus Thiodiazotropha taylori]